MYCNSFKWIGQPLESCDDCGQPAWLHDYEEHRGKSTPWSTKMIAAWMGSGVIDRDRAIEMLSASDEDDLLEGV